MIPTLAGVHHVKLPIADLDRSITWYASRLGYRPVIEFRKRGRRTGWCWFTRPEDPSSAWSLAPRRPTRRPGSTTSPSACPTGRASTSLADHFTALGEQHAGVQFASIGWILPRLHDPDGHEVRFYTVESHTTWTHSTCSSSTTRSGPPAPARRSGGPGELEHADHRQQAMS